MKTEEAVQGLESHIEASYAKTMEPLAPGIVRGHLRSISTDIEDGIALFVLHVLPEGHKLLLDHLSMLTASTTDPICWWSTNQMR